MSDIHRRRVEAVRSLMEENGWDAVIISATDPHCSEYPAPRWKQVEWVSGFTGEAGDIVITADHAGLWTDTRYFIQALEQLQGSGIELHKLRVPEQVTIEQWLPTALPQGSVIAVDGLCLSVGDIGKYSPFTVIDSPDMLDCLWEDRPDIPCTPIETLGEEQVGESRLDKLSWLRKFLMKEDVEGILLSSLDEIAWLLNVRGRDIDYNPFVISHLLVTQENVFWFVRKDSDEQLDCETLDSFDELIADDVEICGYSDVNSILEDWEEGRKLFVDPSSLNWNLSRAVIASVGEENAVYGKSPVILRKAIKNDVEIESQREAYLEDGVAEEKFLFWLEKEVSERDADNPVTEAEASAKLTSLRADIPGFRGESFATISAYGPNAALPHYSTPETGSAVIQSRGLYLVDSGGQYIFGTTDVTRTVPMGECTRLEMEDYTYVLKGMIQLSMAVFPYGTGCCNIDAIARMPLWRAHRNFGHGTGHGIGFYLGVHEGPQDLRQNANTQPMLPGMITSNEPGIYREGLHGVRHENDLLCVDAGTNEFGRWLAFETLTLCHIDTGAILPELLNEEEKAWLNAYNDRVYRKISPRLYGAELHWLREKTLAI